MTHRFFVDSPIRDQVVVLQGQEAHHLIKVMRGKAEDRVFLFDGSGAEFTGEITAVGRSSAEIHVLDRREVDRELSFDLTVAVALPKGDRQRWLIEKLVELGAKTFVPLIAARSVAQPHSKAIERLHRAVIEASKQCGRNRLMRISLPEKIEDYLPRVADRSLNLFADSRARLLAGELSQQTRQFREVGLAIGPEGGFTDEELAIAVNHHWRSVSLGATTLRTETAAVALSSLIVLQPHR